MSARYATLVQPFSIIWWSHLGLYFKILARNDKIPQITVFIRTKPNLEKIKGTSV